MIPIKDCPFCGREPNLYEDNQFSDRYVVACDNCGIEMRSEYGYDYALEKWNNRPVQSAQEPVAYIFLHPLGKAYYHVVDDSCAGRKGVIPVYAFLNEGEV